METCQIIEYEDRYHQAFRAINVEWLNRYNLMETHDIEVLDNPRKYVINKGGVIYLARYEDQIVGSAALIKEHDNVYELAKMGVSAEFRQRGISKLLLETCLNKAKELKATKVMLFSNHQLKAALSLYEKYGFEYIPVKDSPFLTADIKMELTLQ